MALKVKRVYAAAAAADGRDMLGIAPRSTIVAVRADDSGSCALEDGCEFYDDAIASGVDLAVSAGASVINLSLGGESMSPILVSALQRAADANTVIVISAGNDGDTTEGANPDGFALDAIREVTGGTIIIAGSTGTASDDRAISEFSNRAGVGAEFYRRPIIPAISFSGPEQASPRPRSAAPSRCSPERFRP